MFHISADRFNINKIYRHRFHIYNIELKIKCVFRQKYDNLYFLCIEQHITAYNIAPYLTRVSNNGCILGTLLYIYI